MQNTVDIKQTKLVNSLLTWKQLNMRCSTMELQIGRKLIATIRVSC